MILFSMNYNQIFITYFRHNWEFLLIIFLNKQTGQSWAAYVHK